MKKEDLIRWRKRHGLKQDELALLLGVWKNSVSRWELGQRQLPSFLGLALKGIEANIKREKGGDKLKKKTVGKTTRLKGKEA